MPLLARSSSGVRYPAWSLSGEDWHALKAEYRGLGLTAGCCGAPVVPVTSKLGWQFFRHDPGTGCGHDESPEHIVAKTLAARAAQALGFEVATEARAPDGGWRADVLLRHPGRGWRIALEIQLARCPLAAIEARQARYAEAGVRGAWLIGFDPPMPAARRDLPLFRLLPGPEGRLDPWVDCPGPGYRRRQAPLAGFVTLLLTGRVALVEPPAHHLALSAAAAPAACWKCHRPLLLLAAFANAPRGRLAPEGWLPARDLAQEAEVLAAYRRAVPLLLRAEPDLTVLRPPRRPDAKAELQAFCPHCDAPQSLHRLDRTLLDPARLRCWSLADGSAWAPPERVLPYWTWDDQPAD